MSADAQRDSRHRECLESVTDDEDATRTQSIRDGTEKGAERDARDELNQHDNRGRRRSTVVVGEHQQRDPDRVLSRREEGIRGTDSEKQRVPECRAEDG